jgi:hypothetical protein
MHEYAYSTYLCIATLAYVTLFVAHLWVHNKAVRQAAKAALEASIVLAYALLSIACGLAVGASVLL